jgi:hypothetical protein
MLRHLFSTAALPSMALTDQQCDRLACKRSENMWGSQISSTKLSSHSSRNAKLRPISKGKLLSSDGARVANISSDRNDKSLPFAVCINDPEVRPSGSAIETQTQTPSGLAKFVCNGLPAFHSITFNYLTSAHVDGHSLNPMVNQRSANAATTAIKTMPTVTETAAPYG